MAKKRKRTFERDFVRAAVETEQLRKDRPTLAARIIGIMVDLVAVQRPPRGGAKPE